MQESSVTRYRKKVAQLLPKVAHKVVGHCSFYYSKYYWHIPKLFPKLTQYLGYFCKKICHWDLSKIAQSGHTAHDTVSEPSSRSLRIGKDCLVKHAWSFLKKLDHPRHIFHLYLAFFKQTLQFLQQINVKNVHPVYGAGIQTHDFKNMSLLDQGSSDVCYTAGNMNQFCWTLDWQNSHFVLPRLQKSGFNILCILVIVISVLAFYSAENFQFYLVKLLEKNKNRKKMSQGMIALRLAGFINLNFFL